MIIPAADRVKNKKFTTKEAGGLAQRAGRPQMRLKDNKPHPPSKPLVLKKLRPRLGRHQGDLLEDTRRRRLLRYKPKLEVFDDAVHGLIIGYESQENISSRSSPQSGQRMRAKPQRGLPQSR